MASTVKRSSDAQYDQVVSHARASPIGSGADTKSVCVVIAAYNAAGTIARAIGSALGQSHVASVVVVDDASSDSTNAAARAADDGSGRVNVIRLNCNMGPAAARNIAISQSTASYIALLDADDYFLPGRIERLLMIDPASWDLLADDMLIVPESLAASDVPLSPPASAFRRIDLRTFVSGNLPGRAGHRRELGFLKPIMRRQFLVQQRLLYDERMRLGEDYAFYVSALVAGGRFLLASGAGYVAIERAGSLSVRHSAADLARIADFDNRCLRNLRNLTQPERAALREHRAATWRRSVHGAVLDTRRTRGYPAALVRLLQSPGAIPHIVAETSRARLGRTRASSTTPVTRLLIGSTADPRPRNSDHKTGSPMTAAKSTSS